jgi:hypothetical protein
MAVAGNLLDEEQTELLPGSSILGQFVAEGASCSREQVRLEPIHLPLIVTEQEFGQARGKSLLCSLNPGFDWQGNIALSNSISTLDQQSEGEAITLRIACAAVVVFEIMQGATQGTGICYG